jgi:hypothetical protein
MTEPNSANNLYIRLNEHSWLDVVVNENMTFDVLHTTQYMGWHEEIYEALTNKEASDLICNLVEMARKEVSRI